MVDFYPQLVYQSEEPAPVAVVELAGAAEGREVEKITIVRRRQKAGTTPPEPKLEPTKSVPEPQPSQTPSERGQIDITVSQAQYEQIKSKIPWGRIVEGQIEGVGIEIKEVHAGGMVSISFKPVKSLKLLNSAEVCQILNISRSTLAKWTKQGVITSYKLGRLRRFNLEEILEFLCQAI